MAAKYTFTRNSLAYLSDGRQVPANTPRFEPGKFGKAVMVEGGTTNLLPQNQRYAEPDTSGFVVGGGTLTRDTSKTWGGKASFHIVAGWAYAPARISVTAGQSITISAMVQTLTAGGRLGLWFYDSSGANIGQIDTGSLSSSQIVSWTRKSASGTVPANATTAAVFFASTNYAPADNEAWFVGIQVEAKSYATSFADSTRSPETLTIPAAGVLNKDEGTIELRINPITVQNWNNFFFINISTGRFLLFFTSDGVVYWDYGPGNSGLGTGAGVAITGQWLRVAMRWSASKGSRELFVNGQYVDTRSFTPPDSLPATVSIVNNYGALIDDLRISNRARTDAEILAEYASGRPTEVDESTTLKLNFDPFDNADIMIYNNGLVLPFYMQSSRNTKWQLIAPTRDAAEEKEAADGDIDFGTTLANSELSLHGIIEYESIQDKNDKKATLAGQLTDCRNKKLLALESNPDIGIYVRLKGRPEITEYPSWMDVTIPFSAEPFWESIQENYWQGSGTLTNNGTFETPVIIEITGAVTNPSVVIGGQTLTYTGTVPAGQKLVIDTGNQTAKLNGVNALANYNGVFPMLPPGDTSVTAASAGTTVFKWRDRWI